MKPPCLNTASSTDGKRNQEIAESDGDRLLDSRSVERH
jgi:hypothetical protein